MLAIVVVFGVILIFVLAFSSDKKETTVRKLDPTTGTEVVEIHQTTVPSAAQTAARTVVWIILAMILLAIGLLVIMGINLQ